MTHRFFVPALRIPQIPRTRLVDAACAGNPALVLVRATTGMGKTALGVQIAERAAEQGATVVWVEYGLSSTLWQAVVRPLKAAGWLGDGWSLQEEPTRSDIAQWATATQQSEPDVQLVIIVDGYVGSDDSRQDVGLLDALNALPRLHIVLLGTDVGNLDQLLLMLRVPSVLIDDQMMQFTLDEIAQLLSIPRGPASDNSAGTSENTSRDANAILEYSGGWPLGVRVALARRVEGHRVGHVFEQEFIDQYLGESDQEVYDALFLTASVDEITEEMLARMLSVSN